MFAASISNCPTYVLPKYDILQFSQSMHTNFDSLTLCVVFIIFADQKLR